MRFLVTFLVSEAIIEFKLPMHESETKTNHEEQGNSSVKDHNGHKLVQYYQEFLWPGFCNLLKAW